MRILKEDLQLSSNTDLLSDALALFCWAVAERKRGHQILSESAGGERKILVLPHLERVAPDLALPRIQIEWTAGELESLARLSSSEHANPPTATLIQAMRD